MNTYASQSVLPGGPQEDPHLAKMSPSKRTALALDKSPIFAPLEVKFKNMSKFEASAKKNLNGRKYPTIDINTEVSSRLLEQTIEDEEPSKALQRRASMGSIHSEHR